MSDSDYLTRRRLLEVASAAAVGVGAMGSASASHVDPGGCYRTTAKVGTYYRACPNEDPGPFYPEGTAGYVWSTCTTTDGEEMVDFVPYDDSLPRAWVAAQWLERC